MPEIRAATVADVDQVLELLEARSRVAFGRSEVSRPFVEAEFLRSVAGRVVAEQGGRVVGYAHLGPTNQVVVAADNPDTSDALLEQIEQHARERGADVIEATVVAEDVPFYALVQRGGFVHDRDILRMWRVLDADVKEPTWPDGVAVRTYQDADCEQVKTLIDDAYAWDAHYAPQSLEGWLEFMTSYDEFDPSLWFLVERDGELVACAIHWKEHGRRGWLKDIAVHASERGAGLGKSLVRHGLRAYADRGVERVGLKVDAANPTGAADLYAREGFVTDQHLEVWRKAL